MAEYIEREALLSEFGEEPYVWNDDAWEIQANDDYKYYKELVEKASAVDVTPVVHGRWIGSKLFDGRDCYQCDKCKAAISAEEFEPYIWNFCPVCGAKMDGGE